MTDQEIAARWRELHRRLDALLESVRSIQPLEHLTPREGTTTLTDTGAPS